MTSSTEVIEATWKIPNFLQSAKTSPYLQSANSDSFSFSSLSSDFRKVFFVGGGVPQTHPNWPDSMPISMSPNLLPIKLEVSVYKYKFTFDKITKVHWNLIVRDCEMQNVPISCTLVGNFLEIKTFISEKTSHLKELKLPQTKEVNFKTEAFATIKLFKDSVAENYVDKADGSLNIYFKMKFTLNQPSSSSADLVNVVVPNDFSKLSNDFESLLKTSRNADVVIRASLGEGQSFRCHKLVLAARSEVFRAMFESDMKEAKANVVEVDDILPKTMQHFLSFIYCGRFADSSWIQSLPQLAYASDKYCVNSLKNLCDLQLIRSVTFRNALAVWKLAERHGLKKAAKDIRQFIDENADKLPPDMDVDANNSDANFKLTYTIS